MNKFAMEKNQFLQQEIVGYYHTNFYGSRHPENPNFLYKLKNDPHHDWSPEQLQSACDDLYSILRADLPKIMQSTRLQFLTICTVPRAKSNNFYRPNQLLFKEVVSHYAKMTDGFYNGTNFITRHTNTKTTHLRNYMPGFNNDGKMPYPGIALNTCHFSHSIKGEDILLVDDIYTKTVNVDEDMVQALFYKGARTVTFYAIGNTVKKF